MYKYVIGTMPFSLDERLDLYYFFNIYLSSDFTACGPPRWLSGRAFTSHVGEIRDRPPGRDIPKSFKQIVTAPLPIARQQVLL